MTGDGARGELPTDGLFRELDPEAAQALLAAATSKEYGPATVLFHQGDDPSHLFQLRSGMVRLTQVTSAGLQTTIRVMGPGDLVGCVAFIQALPYPATATASESAWALLWSASQFADLSARFPAIGANLTRTVGSRAKEMVERVVDLTSRTAEQRLAILLLQMADRFGRTVEPGIEIRGPTLRHDLAEMGGATYHTITRILSRWEKDGIVSSGRERIAILRMQALESIAELPAG